MVWCGLSAPAPTGHRGQTGKTGTEQEHGGGFGDWGRGATVRWRPARLKRRRRNGAALFRKYLSGPQKATANGGGPEPGHKKPGRAGWPCPEARSGKEQWSISCGDGGTRPPARPDQCRTGAWCRVRGRGWRWLLQGNPDTTREKSDFHLAG